MATTFYPLEACQANALERQTALAGCEVRLYKSDLDPSPSTPLTEFDANEADYDTYAAITIAAWNNPILAPGTGYMIGSPLVQFAVGAAVPTTPNLIGGCYIVDTGGVIRSVVKFDAPVPMQLPGQGIPLNFVDLFPTGL